MICEKQSVLQFFFDFTLLPEDIELQDEVKEYFKSTPNEMRYYTEHKNDDFLTAYASVLDIPILNRLTKELKNKHSTFSNIIIHAGAAHTTRYISFVNKYFPFESHIKY